jgi:glycine/D-amino acid oxidase-like deaminating enzyme
LAHPSASLFTPDFKADPYWWDATPRPRIPSSPLSAEADVAVIGSGYTGLSAALQTARGGRSTLVLDAEAAGWGCSSRNGGQVGTSIKPQFPALSAKWGPERARAIIKEGFAALDWIGDFVRAEAIDCDFEVSGRYIAAHNPAAYERLGREIAAEPPDIAEETHMVPRAEQARELGSAAYHGGCVYPAHAALDPGRYHSGLLARAMSAGAAIAPSTRALAIEREGSRFKVTTERGIVMARDVIVATNGYTGPLTPWLRRRIIPIGSYIIATEPIDPKLMDRLFPTRRMIDDTRRVIFYYRTSPDRQRILFGGRVAVAETDPLVSAPRLKAELVKLFPELAPIRISHSWLGFVAFTFDTMPHIGAIDGIRYAMGYCGAGISLASYFGAKLGQQVLGRAEGKTALDGLAFETRPLYTGTPWFLGPSIRWYQFLDSLNI